MVPDAAACFDEMAKEAGGPEAVRRWAKKFGMADPYMTVVCGNIEDGSSVALSGKPVDRGEFTLPYPFVTH
jgi:hypothetical protein